MAKTLTDDELAQLERQEQEQAQSQAQNDEFAQDLSILFPNQSLLIGSKTVKIKEYAFVEWLNLRQTYAPFIAKFTGLMTANDDVLVDDVLEFFENEFADLKGLILASIDEPADFLDGLTLTEMESLMLGWWQVNKHFFMKSVVRAVRKSQTPINEKSVGAM